MTSLLASAALNNWALVFYKPLHLNKADLFVHVYQYHKQVFHFTFCTSINAEGYPPNLSYRPCSFNPIALRMAKALCALVLIQVSILLGCGTGWGN